MNGTILVYNNNTGVMDMIQPLFAGEGYELVTVREQNEILRMLEGDKIQLLLTDIELEEEDGMGTISRVRAMSSMPIIVLSKRTDESDKIGALDAGADDYVTYPCNPLELLARVKSQLRRYRQLANLHDNIQGIYKVDGLIIDDARRKVMVEGREVRLTPLEYKILKLLVRERGRVLSNEQIYESIWHMQAIGADNTIAVHIRHIREKIEENPREPRYLKVVWGTGYKVG